MMVKESSKPFLFGGLLIAGIAGYLYYQNSQNITQMGNRGDIGGSNEFRSNPGILGVDSTTAGIEDTPTPENVGTNDISDSALANFLKNWNKRGNTTDISEPILSESDINDLAGYGGLFGAGFVANRLLKSTAVKTASMGAGGLARLAGGGLKVAGVASKAVPIIGTAWMLKDVSDITGMTADAYGGSIPDYSQTIQSNWNGFLNTIGLKDPATGENYPTLPKAGQKTGNIMEVTNVVNKSDDVKNNVGVSLDKIMGNTDSQTWEHTFHSEKTGESLSKGIQTDTWKSSSGQQVALAGITPENYAKYLAEKGK